jgi:hypothetical protein
MRDRRFAWWQKWGQTIVLGGSLLFSAHMALRSLDAKFHEVLLRLQRIEIVLGIDPMTKDLPGRAAPARSAARGVEQ